MKIYRLLECTGYYEDYFEHRLGTYLHKEDAIAARKKAETSSKEAEKQSELCAQCIGYDDTEKCQRLCMSFKEVKGDPSDCANYFSIWEPATYKIEEEEVIE